MFNSFATYYFSYNRCCNLYNIFTELALYHLYGNFDSFAVLLPVVISNITCFLNLSINKNFSYNYTNIEHDTGLVLLSFINTVTHVDTRTHTCTNSPQLNVSCECPIIGDIIMCMSRWVLLLSMFWSGQLKLLYSVGTIAVSCGWPLNIITFILEMLAIVDWVVAN